ncbi:uncharacterized protein UDID_01899 [Ustilago sp. UG-2017a]|nr:uncharacterized protein UDID_01899 [Ustilago sp. UG-2017a]
MSLLASQRLPSGHNVLIQQSRSPGAYRTYSVLEGRREIRLVPLRIRGGSKLNNTASASHPHRSRSRLLDPHPRVTTREDDMWKHQEDRILREGLNMIPKHRPAGQGVSRSQNLAHHRVNKRRGTLAQQQQAQRLAQLEAQQWITLAELKRLSLNKAQDELLREMRSLLEAQQRFKVSKDPSIFSRAMSVVTELRDWLCVTLAEMLQDATEARDPAPAEEKPSGRQVISRNAVKAISFGLFYPILHYHAVTTNAADIMGVFLQTASLPMVLAMNPSMAKACHRIKKRGVLKGLFGGKKLRRSLSSSTSSHGYRKDVRR